MSAAVTTALPTDADMGTNSSASGIRIVITTETEDAQSPTLSTASLTSTSNGVSSTIVNNNNNSNNSNNNINNIKTDNGALLKNPAICRYYLRGICRFGSLCRFSHDGAGGEFNTSTSDSNENIAQASTSAAISNNKKLSDWANAPAFVPSGKLILNNFNSNENEIENNNTKTNDDEQELLSSSSSSQLDQASGVVELGVDVGAGNNKTWAEIVGGNNYDPPGYIRGGAYIKYSEPGSVNMLCPYENPCPYGDFCAYTMHLQLCKMCDLFCLHPTDGEQRRKHNQECLQQHEKDMELSFAIARSRDKTCGICMDTIMEKAGREKRFGILPNCTHIFCLECIRKWRQAKQFEPKITRSCPECRIASDFVCPSAFWVETKEEKEKLLTDYRAALGIKDCKYFKKGSGKCPFGNKCFYKHANANGELVDVGGPRRVRKIRQGDEIIDLLDIYLWEFVDHRDINLLELLSSTSEFNYDGDDDEDDDEDFL